MIVKVDKRKKRKFKLSSGTMTVCCTRAISGELAVEEFQRGWG